MPSGEVPTISVTRYVRSVMIPPKGCRWCVSMLRSWSGGPGGAWWFQVYVMRDRGLTQRLAERAAAAGARALVLTADTPLVGIRNRDISAVAVPDADLHVNTGPLAEAALAGQAPDVTAAEI